MGTHSVIAKTAAIRLAFAAEGQRLRHDTGIVGMMTHLSIEMN